MGLNFGSKRDVRIITGELETAKKLVDDLTKELASLKAPKEEKEDKDAKGKKGKEGKD